MSAGSRSLVNWMRWNDSERDLASACASVVFPTPGTSSSRMCPFASIAAMQNCTTSLLPRITVSTFAWSAAILSAVRGRVTGCVVISLTYTAHTGETCRVQQGHLPIHSPADTLPSTMLDAAGLFVFLGTGLVILLTPGPADLYIVARTLDQGRRAGLVSVLGIAVGTLVHIAAATLGISAILVRSAVAFKTVRYAGAAYLLWLGIQKLRH